MSNITDIKSVLTQKGLNIFRHKFHIPDDVHPDPFRKSTEFSADDYAILVAHPAPFRKFSEPFLCLVGMSRYYTLDEDTYLSFLYDDETGGCLLLYIVHPAIFFDPVFDLFFVYADIDLFAFIQVVDPTKVRVVEREHFEGEPKLLNSTIGHVVPLLPVAPAHAESELKTSVDKLFDEGGSADQGYSAVCGGQDVETELVTGVKIIVDENVVAERPKRIRKKRSAVTDASGSSHPPKKLRGDYGTSSGAATGGKSPSVLKEFLASSILNVKVGVVDVATLPLVTSSVSAMLEHKSGAPTDSITGLNLRTVGASERLVISSDSSHYSSTNAFGSEGNSIIMFDVVPPVMTEAVVTSHAVNAPSILVSKMGTKITSLVLKVVPSYFAKQDILTGSRELNAETLCQIHEMGYHHLFTVRTTHQACLNEEVRMQTEYCLSERTWLESECEKQASLLKARDDEVENLKAQLLLKETEAAEATRLRAQVSAVEATKKMHAKEIDALKQRNVALENEKDSLDGKVTELQSLVSAKDLELKDLNVDVSSLKSQNDGLVDQVHALETTCSNLRDQVAKLDADLLEMALQLEEKFYPRLLTTISGRRWLLTHGVKLAVVKCLNSQEYLTALGSAISRAIKKGMQDGLSAGIDHRKAGRNLADVVAYNMDAEANYNSALQRLREVNFPLLAELNTYKNASTANIMDLLCLESPLADAPSLIGTTSTSSSVPATVVSTTALYTTFASASSVPPITTDDYDIVNVDGQEDTQGNVASFPTVEFEKEEPDTTLECDPSS
nr:hypothetical protein [Tanacetum cinerariifolium]